MSTPGRHDDETEPVDPAAAQALPADAGVAPGSKDAPDATTRVHDVPAPEAAVGSRALGSATDAGSGEAVTTGGAAGGAAGDDVVRRGSGLSDEQAPPEGAETGGPSGTAMGTPGGVAAGITDKIPSSVTDKASELTDKLPVDAQVIEEKPELLVGGAFVGGFLFAKVLRRIAGV